MHPMDIVSVSGPLGLASGLAGLLVLFLLALLSLLIPVFVWRIWVWSARSNRELQQLNVTLEQIMALLEASPAAGAMLAEKPPLAAPAAALTTAGDPAPEEDLFPPAEVYANDEEILEGEPLDDDFGDVFAGSDEAKLPWQDTDLAAAEVAEEKPAPAPGTEEEPSFSGFDTALSGAPPDQFPDLDFEADPAREEVEDEDPSGQPFATEDPFAAASQEDDGPQPPAWVPPASTFPEFEPPAAEAPEPAVAAFEAPAAPDPAEDSAFDQPVAAAPGSTPMPEAPAAAPPEPAAAAPPPDIIRLPQDPQRPATNLARCGGCGHKLAYKESLAGKRVKCPSCQKPLVLP